MAAHLFDLQRQINKIYPLTRVRSYYGPVFAPNFGDLTFRFYVVGTYGDFYWDRISSISSDFVFLDIGANQGLYSLCAAENPHCKQVHAFEPVAMTCRRLERNLQLNGLSERVRVHQKAISDCAGEAKIQVFAEHSGRATLRSPASSGLAPRLESVELIDGFALDRIVDWRPGTPIFVKIDVEGHELAVLRALRQTSFHTDIAEIFYEADDSWVEPEATQTLLREMGFAVSTKLGEGAHRDELAVRVPG